MNAGALTKPHGKCFIQSHGAGRWQSQVLCRHRSRLQVRTYQGGAHKVFPESGGRWDVLRGNPGKSVGAKAEELWARKSESHHYRGRWVLECVKDGWRHLRRLMHCVKWFESYSRSPISLYSACGCIKELSCGIIHIWITHVQGSLVP